jgi:hypothetical protein
MAAEAQGRPAHGVGGAIQNNQIRRRALLQELGHAGEPEAVDACHRLWRFGLVMEAHPGQTRHAFVFSSLMVAG